MKYKNHIIIIFSIICLFAIFLKTPASIAFAVGKDDELEESIFNENFDYSAIYPYITEDIKKIFGIDGINDKNISELKQMNIQELSTYIISVAKSNIQMPIKFLLSFFIILIMSSFISKTNNLLSDNCMFDNLCSIFVIFLVYKYFFGYFEDVNSAINQCADFFTAFIPIFSSTLFVSSGEVTTSSYSVMTLAASDIIVQISNYIILPFLYICFALGISNSVNTFFSFYDIIKRTQKIIQSSLKVILSLYSGILSLQTILSSNADGIGTKAAKMLISNSVPFVGSAISDAYTSVKASIQMLRGGLGAIAFGILLTYAIPIIFRLLVCRLIFGIASVISDLFDKKQFTKLFDTMESIYSITYALIITVFVIFIISIAIAIVLIRG